MVSVLSLWFIPGSDPRRTQFYFSKNKLTERSLKCSCLWVNWMVTEWWLKCDWNPPFPSPFSQLKGEISSCVCSVSAICQPYNVSGFRHWCYNNFFQQWYTKIANSVYLVFPCANSNIFWSWVWSVRFHRVETNFRGITMSICLSGLVNLFVNTIL